jgi:hypothetical protein
VRNNGRYRAALLRAFVERGLFGLQTVNGLNAAPVPTLQPAPLAAGPGGAALGIAPFGDSGQGGGSQTVLSFGDEMPGYRSEGSTAPELPLHAVTAEFLDAPVLVHAAIERDRFQVAPAAVATGPADAVGEARHFLEDLIQTGRLDAGSSAGIVGELNVSNKQAHTHKLERIGSGLVLKRVQFECGFCCHHG